MSLIRHLIVALALVLVVPATGAAVSGCTQPVFPSNVIAGAQAAAQTAQTVVTGAQAVWPIILAALPADKQAVAQDDFNKAVFAANHAILALNDAVQAAILANTTPDFTAVISQVADAVAQVVTIVQSFQSAAPPSAMAAVGARIKIGVPVSSRTASAVVAMAGLA